MWLLAACVDAPPASTPADSACEDSGVSGVTAELTDIPTVIRVRWTTDAELESYVSFETPTGTGSTPATSGAEHEALLIGNHARSDVEWHVVTSAGNSCVRTTTTGSFFTGLPEATVSGDPAEGPGWVLAPILQADDTALAMLDNTGDYIWAWTPEGDDKATAFYGAELSLDGTSILMNIQAPSESLPGPIYRIGLDGTLLDPILVNGAHTDFVQLPDGGFGVLAWEVRAFDDRRLLGDTIVEVDPDGATRTVWSVWDDFSPDLSTHYEPGWYPADLQVEDWSHINGISYDPVVDTYLVTASFNESVLTIDRTTGALDGLLSDDAGDWEGDGLVSFPHSVEPVSGGVLLFNRGDIHDSATCSEATEVSLDGTSAAVIWRWTSEICLLVPFLGGAERLATGSTLVDWTTSGQLDHVSADEELLWRVNLDLGGAFGFADTIEQPWPIGG